MRPNRALESVEHEKSRGTRTGRDPEEVEKVSVGSVPALEVSCAGKRNPPRKFAPQGLSVGPGHPPGRRECRRTGRGDYHSARPQPSNNPPPILEDDCVDVQIFGIKNSADTRKALRFFSERRIKTHFVDLKERPASPGELTRFAQKFGVKSLLDEQSARYQELGLRSAVFGDRRWLELLAEEPLLLRMPLVRKGNELSIGLAEEAWRKWYEAT